MWSFTYQSLRALHRLNTLFNPKMSHERSFPVEAKQTVQPLLKQFSGLGRASRLPASGPLVWLAHSCVHLFLCPWADVLTHWASPFLLKKWASKQSQTLLMSGKTRVRNGGVVHIHLRCLCGLASSPELTSWPNIPQEKTPPHTAGDMNHLTEYLLFFFFFFGFFFFFTTRDLWF